MILFILHREINEIIIDLWFYILFLFIQHREQPTSSHRYPISINIPIKLTFYICSNSVTWI